MNGPEHWNAAETALNDANDPDLSSQSIRELIGIAQVHATLALTAATVAVGELPIGPSWYKAIGT